MGRNPQEARVLHCGNNLIDTIPILFAVESSSDMQQHHVARRCTKHFFHNPGTNAPFPKRALAMARQRNQIYIVFSGLFKDFYGRPAKSDLMANKKRTSCAAPSGICDAGCRSQSLQSKVRFADYTEVNGQALSALRRPQPQFLGRMAKPTLRLGYLCSA